MIKIITCMLTKAPRSAIEDYWLPPLHWLMDLVPLLILLMHKGFEYLLSAVMRYNPASIHSRLYFFGTS